jgi:hypothetical protein
LSELKFYIDQLLYNNRADYDNKAPMTQHINASGSNRSNGDIPTIQPPKTPKGTKDVSDAHHRATRYSN